MGRHFRALVLSSALVGLALAQKAPRVRMPECGNDRSHSCQCMARTNRLQNEYMATCEAEHVKNPRETPGQIAVACLAAMQTHCALVEHYGNWSTDENGNHDNPMPQQCTRACTRSHCLCDADGAICHLSHDPKEDRAK